MPIYEYLCVPCNRVFSFLVRNPAAKKEPHCPKCGAAQLRKRFSRFAVAGARPKSRDADPTAGAPAAPAGGRSEPLDDPRVEREMMQLMSQAEGIDDKDPRQMGRLMRRMSEISGERLDGEMEETVRRLESGEDPEKLDEELGGDGTDGGGASAAPSYDNGLYDL
jgi:putative FmdB family regulatory protein